MKPSRCSLTALLLAALAAYPLFFDRSERPRPATRIADLLGSEDADGFARVAGPADWRFPRDHGPHPAFRQEWWYVTGNLHSEPEGEPFGYQLTLFRVALRPDPPLRASAWGTNQLYMGHLAITDPTGQRHHHVQRFARQALGLAGARGEPDFAVWLESWSLTQNGGTPEKPRLHLQAADGELALALELTALKPLIPQGEGGVSQKSEHADAASFYYSLTRLETVGELRVGGKSRRVRGTSWLDREWSSSALASHQAGWDWFALQLDGGEEIMFYRLRNKDGSDDARSAGSFVDPAGVATPLSGTHFRPEATGRWRSPRSGITYPSGWTIDLPERKMHLTLVPRLQDQELSETVTPYWEGAVAVHGEQRGAPVSGAGYVELTGYGGSAPERSAAQH